MHEVETNRIMANVGHSSNITRCVYLSCACCGQTLVILTFQTHHVSAETSRCPTSFQNARPGLSCTFITGSMCNIVVSATLQCIPCTVIPISLTADCCIPLNPALAQNNYTSTIFSCIAVAMTPPWLECGWSCAQSIFFHPTSCQRHAHGLDQLNPYCRPPVPPKISTTVWLQNFHHLYRLYDHTVIYHQWHGAQPY